MNETLAYWPVTQPNRRFVPLPGDPGMASFLKTQMVSALYHSPAWSIDRAAEIYGTEEANWERGAVKLSPDQANEKYGLGGLIKFEDPVYEDVAQIMMGRKLSEVARDRTSEAGAISGGRRAASMAVGLGAAMLDPVNVASMFVPVVGEARYARMLKDAGGSLWKARATRGAIEGIVGMGMVEPFIVLPAMQEQSNYNLRDSAVNLGFGTILGGLLHVGIGAAGDLIGKVSKRPNIVEDNLRTAGDTIHRLKPEDQDEIFKAALNDVLNDDPVQSPAKLVPLARVERPAIIEASIPRNANSPEGLSYLTTQLGVSEDVVAKISKVERQRMLDEPQYLQQRSAEILARERGITVEEAKVEVQQKQESQWEFSFGPKKQSGEDLMKEFKGRYSSALEALQEVIDADPNADIGRFEQVLDNLGDLQSVFDRLAEMGLKVEDISDITNGSESLVLILKNGFVVKVGVSGYIPDIPGITTRSVAQFYRGLLDVEISERVKTEIPGKFNFDQVYDMEDDIRGLGLEPTDIHEDNIGFINGKPVLIDKGSFTTKLGPDDFSEEGQKYLQELRRQQSEQKYFEDNYKQIMLEREQRAEVPKAPTKDKQIETVTKQVEEVKKEPKSKKSAKVSKMKLKPEERAKLEAQFKEEMDLDLNDSELQLLKQIDGDSVDHAAHEKAIQAGIACVMKNMV